MESESKYDDEVFIDADSGFQNEKNSYEVIILRQLTECVKVLSREMTGGQVIHKTNQTGTTEKYIEDVRELVINHVDTLRMLLCTYIEKDNKKQIEKINKEIKHYKNVMGEVTVQTTVGPKKMKELKNIPVDNPAWKDFINFKAKKYREMFEVLVNAYNEQKAYIRSLEEE